MDPAKIPFNAPIAGPTNSGKTKYLVDQLRGPFRGKFDYIVLICPRLLSTTRQNEVDAWLFFSSVFFEGTNTLLILDDCAASKDVKGRFNHLVKLTFSARHIGISVWVLTQQFTSNSKPFRKKTLRQSFFFTPRPRRT